jgi:hypothetical protein
MSNNIKELERVNLTTTSLRTVTQLVSLIDNRNKVIEYWDKGDDKEKNEESCRSMVNHYNDFIREILAL